MNDPFSKAIVATVMIATDILRRFLVAYFAEVYSLYCVSGRLDWMFVISNLGFVLLVFDSHMIRECFL
jgi:hypothetical protein